LQQIDSLLSGKGTTVFTVFTATAGTAGYRLLISTVGLAKNLFQFFFSGERLENGRRNESRR